MKKTACVRVFADTEHIRHCQTRLTEVASSLRSAAAIMALAGNEVRLQILFSLAEEQQLCVCDLADVLKMNISAVSQHLRKLKDGGMVRARKVGQTVYYDLNPEHLPMLQPLVAGFPLPLTETTQ